MSIRLLRNPFKRTVVANSEAAPVTQDDTRLERIEAERRTLHLVGQEVANFHLSLIRAEEIRKLTIAHNKTCADLAEAKRLHKPTAELQARAEALNIQLLEIDLEALRDAQS